MMPDIDLVTLIPRIAFASPRFFISNLLLMKFLTSFARSKSGANIVRSMPSNANEDTCIKMINLYYTFLLLIIGIYFDVHINLVMAF